MCVTYQVMASCSDVPGLVSKLELLPPFSDSTIAAYLSYGDFVVRIRDSGGSASIVIHSVFRENRDCGRSWWSTCTVDAAGETHEDLLRDVVRVVLATLTTSRDRFARLLADAGPAAA